MTCDCEKYEHLELYREKIDKRIKDTKKIRKNLKKIASQQNDYYLLWACPVCNQLWQSSNAWNWGAKEYIYKVPETSVESWLEEPFIKPDELLLHSAMLEQFERGIIFIETDKECKKEDCRRNSIRYSVFCKKHHIESLQKAGALPEFPGGRMFEPYF